MNTLSPWFWKIPTRQWLAYWLHYPPEWAWKLLALVPCRLRWKLGGWVSDLPGACGCMVHSIGAADYPHSGTTAARCMRDGAPCWCGKYQEFAGWSRDLAALPSDPIRDVRITGRET